MGTNQIALSIEQMKHLEELGLNTSDASMHYIHRDFDELCTVDAVAHENDDVYAYSFQDLWEKIPVIFDGEDTELPVIWSCYDRVAKKKYYECAYIDNEANIIFDTEFIGLSTLEVAYKLLIWCLKSRDNFIEVKDDDK